MTYCVVSERAPARPGNGPVARRWVTVSLEIPAVLRRVKRKVRKRERGGGRGGALKTRAQRRERARAGTWPPPAESTSRLVHSPRRTRRRSCARGPRKVPARTAAVRERLRARCALNSPQGDPSCGTVARPAAGQFPAGGPSACRMWPRPVAGPRRTARRPVPSRCTCGNQPAIR